MNPNATYALASAELTTKLRFDSSDGFARAIADGFFFVRSPSLDLAAGDTFARNYLPRQGGASARPTGVSAVDRRSAARREGIFLLPLTSTRSSSSSSRADLADSVPRPFAAAGQN